MREFLALALPNVLSNLSVPLSGLIGLVFLGHLPRLEPLAGVVLGGVLFNYIYWAFGFLRMGTTGLTARASGAGQEEEVADLLFRGLWLAGGIAAGVLLLQGPLAGLGFWLLGSTAAVEVEGRAYFQARVWDAPATLGLYVVNGWLLGRGRSKDVLLISLALHGLHVLLDAVLVWRLGLGAWGAGLACSLSATAAFGLGSLLVCRSWGSLPGFRSGRVLRWPELRRLLRFNADLMVRTLCLISALASFTSLSAGFGVVVLAANTLLMKLLSVASYFLDGYAYALEVLAGQRAGSGQLGGVRRALWVAAAWTGVTTMVFLVGLKLTGPSILGRMTGHQGVVEQAAAALPWLLAALPLAAGAYLLDGLFVGLARGRALRDSMALALGLGFLPLALWSREVGSLGLLWAALVAFMGLRALLLAVRVPAALAGCARARPGASAAARESAEDGTFVLE